MVDVAFQLHHRDTTPFTRHVCDHAGSVKRYSVGKSATARVFSKDQRVSHTAVVENKRLGHALSLIKAAQDIKHEPKVHTNSEKLGYKKRQRKLYGPDYEAPIAPPAEAVEMTAYGKGRTMKLFHPSHSPGNRQSRRFRTFPPHDYCLIRILTFLSGAQRDIPIGFQHANGRDSG